MEGLTSSWPPRSASGRGPGRNALWVGGSLAFHALVLGWLALTAPGTAGRGPLWTGADRPIEIDMETRPLLPGEALRKAARPHADARPARAEPSVPPALAARPEPPAPRLAAAPPADVPAPPADPWRIRPEDAGAGIGRSLRGGALGCRAHDDGRSAAEQEACDRRIGEAAARAGPPGPRLLTAAEARRDAAFAREGARALADYEARRRPLNSGVGVTGPADCVGSNFGTGCAGAHLDPAIRQGATTNLREGGSRPDAMRPVPGND